MDTRVLDGILEWGAGRPAWQQTAIRLLLQGELSDEALLALVDQCVEEARGSGSAKPAPTLVVPDDLGGSPAAAPVVQLVAISELTNVNALADDQTLSFAEAGLTIVQGDNGSGKSGYARILKQVCRARSAQEVLPHAFSDAADTPQAEVTFSLDGAPVAPPVIDERWRGRIDELFESNRQLKATSSIRLLEPEGFDVGYSTLTKYLRQLWGPRVPSHGAETRPSARPCDVRERPGLGRPYCGSAGVWQLPPMEVMARRALACLRRLATMLPAKGGGMVKRLMALAFALAMAATACQGEGDRILQASACQTLSQVGDVARYYADGGLGARKDDVITHVDFLRLHQVSPEVLASASGDVVHRFREAVLLALTRQNVVSDTGGETPEWDALIAQGIEAWDDIGCARHLLSPAPWMPECHELEELNYRVRATCLSQDERDELRQQSED